MKRVTCFLSLALLPKPVSTDNLQIAHTASAMRRTESFLDSLRPLEDSFAKIKKPYGSTRLVEFRNPSLQDFAYLYLNENTDYLDTLLSHPAFFSRRRIYSPLYTHTGWTYKITEGSGRPHKRKGDPKYPMIKAWVDRRSSRLLENAVDLLDSEPAEIYGHADRSRLSQLLEIAKMQTLFCAQQRTAPASCWRCAEPSTQGKRKCIDAFD